MLKVRRFLVARQFPVNAKVGQAHVTSARVDGLLFFRGHPKALAVDLGNRVLWFVYEERRSDALLPSAVSSFEVRDQPAFCRKKKRILVLTAEPEQSLRFQIVGGNEAEFSVAMTELLRISRKD